MDFAHHTKVGLTDVDFWLKFQVGLVHNTDQDVFLSTYFSMRGFKSKSVRDERHLAKKRWIDYCE
jgi:hypothetical protein